MYRRKNLSKPSLITLTKLVTVELITKLFWKIIDYFDHSAFTINFLQLVDFNRWAGCVAYAGNLA